MSARQFRTSERTTFTRCKQSWYWHYQQNLKPRLESAPLRFGTLVHFALADWYQLGTDRGLHPTLTFQRLMDEEWKAAKNARMRVDEDEWVSMQALGTYMLDEYVDRYGEDEDWEVLAVEHRFYVRIPRTDITIVGTLDLVMRQISTGRVYIWDHKTTAAIMTAYLDLDEQAGTYLTYGVAGLRQAKLLGPKVPIAGMMYNFLRKGKPDDRPRNPAGLYLNKPTKNDLLSYNLAQGATRIRPTEAKKMTIDQLIAELPPDCLQLGEVSKAQPAPMFHREPILRGVEERKKVMARIRLQVEDILRYESGELELYKSPGKDHCSWCGVRELCKIHEMNGDVDEITRGVYRTWEPYSSYELEQEDR